MGDCGNDTTREGVTARGSESTKGGEESSLSLLTTACACIFASRIQSRALVFYQSRPYFYD